MTIADQTGDMAVVECNPYAVEVIRPNQDGPFVVTANDFNSAAMAKYKNDEGLDDWRSKERYTVAYNALKQQNSQFTFACVNDILAGKYGFMCQYDRRTGADTVWSVIYDIKNKAIYRVEGNPSRKAFKEDKRKI